VQNTPRRGTPLQSHNYDGEVQATGRRKWTADGLRGTDAYWLQGKWVGGNSLGAEHRSADSSCRQIDQFDADRNWLESSNK